MLRFDRRQATTLYMESLELLLNPYETLRTVLGVSTYQSRHIVTLLEAEGYLGKYPHRPTRAVIHRNSNRIKTWLCCEECTEKWPCPQAFPTPVVSPRPAPVGTTATKGRRPDGRVRPYAGSSVAARQRTGTDD